MATYQSQVPQVITARRISVDCAPRSHRSVIICLDGTGDQFDADNSNVVKFFAALKKDDPSQLTYYQSGVGTYSDSYRGSLKSGLSAALDMAVGASLGTHVREAYSFLMQNYREGDKISLIGFSRGAYTARALAGMLYKVGLLPAHNQAQISFAYRWYKDDSPNGWKMSADFKRTFSIDVRVHFLGCWDTVASVGIVPRILPFAKTDNAAVNYFRHALALDERRAKFKANHWFQRGPGLTCVEEEEGTRDHQEDTASKSGTLSEKSVQQAINSHMRRSVLNSETFETPAAPSIGSFGFFGNVPVVESPKEEKDLSLELTDTREHASPRKPRRFSLPILRLDSKSEAAKVLADGDKSERERVQEESVKQDKLMKQFYQADSREYGCHTGKTDVLEVWFLGCHADCGGGAVPNETRHMLSRIPLRWMIRQAFACDAHILFLSDVLIELGMDIDTLYPVLQERKPPVAGPSPSSLDGYATNTLPSLATRRDSFRRQSSLCAGAAQVTPSNTLCSLTNLDGSEQKDEGLCVLPEEQEDYFDALSPINDQLKLSWPWWILELWPVKCRVRTTDGKGWKKKVGPNWGRHRVIRDSKPNVHWTVREREKAQKYSIKCETSNSVQWSVAY